MLRKVVGWILRVLSIFAGLAVVLILLMTIFKAWKLGGFTMVQALLSPFNISYYFQAITMLIPVALLHVGAEKLLETKPVFVQTQDDTIDS